MKRHSEFRLSGKSKCRRVSVTLVRVTTAGTFAHALESTRRVGLRFPPAGAGSRLRGDDATIARQAGVLTMDEARRTAANIVMLADL
jgi:hypothetical protein